MKKTTLLFILIGIFLVLFLGIYAFGLLHKKAVTAPPATNFPVASSTQATAQNPSGKMVSIPSRTGGSYQAFDFIDNGKTIPDVENPGNYQLAGDLPYCLPNTKCTAAPSTEFSIGYNGAGHSFTVALQSEPLGQARLDAEQFLMSELGLTEAQMCTLSYYVGTSNAVSDVYDGENLGFSFCPGAVKLP